MRILVVSDTHHDVFSLRTAILRQPKAEVVIHLGDGEEEAAQLKPHFPDKAFRLGLCPAHFWGNYPGGEEDLLYPWSCI